MKKTYWIVITAAFCLLLTSSAAGADSGCLKGNNKIKTETRALQPFKALRIGGAFDVVITCGKKQQVALTTDENLLPKISTKVEGDVLHVATKGSICTKNDLKVTIDIDQMERIVTDGAVDINITGIDNAAFRIDGDGAGDIEAKGRTKNFTVSLSGAGDLQAGNLIAESVKITIQGASDALVNATQKLDAKVDGAGSVNYRGNPKEIKRKVSGAGDIEED